MTLARNLVSTAARRTPQPLIDFLYKHRSSRLLRLARRVAARGLGDTREGVLITRGPLAGHRLAFEGLIGLWMGRHEPTVQQAIERLLGPGQVAYDIGAHVGYFVMLMACRVGDEGRVVAFEPERESYRLLERNIDLNGLRGRVELRRQALGAEPGSGETQAGWHSGLTVVTGTQTGDVTISTLDVEVYERGLVPPDLILIDTEGAEVEIFRGARRLLSEHAPAVLSEIHGNREAIGALLGELGYRAQDIDVGHVLFRKEGSRGKDGGAGDAGRRP